MTSVGECASLVLPDGRTLDYWVGGDPGGRPVLFQPGTPCGRLHGLLAHDAALAARVRLVCISRPGYGGSTLAPHGLAVVAQDTLGLADHLGLDRFVALAESGGGPYALAAAAAGGDRVTAVALLAGVGPWPEIDPPSTIDGGERLVLSKARAGDLEGAWAAFRVDAGQAFDAMLGLDDEAMMAEFTAGLPAADAALFDSRARTLWAADLRDALTTYDGFIRDNLSWGLPWDLALSDVRCPVRLWYGEQDLMVPARHGRWLAERLPDADLVVLAGEGHGRTTAGHLPEVFRTMLRDG
jgi:pimeloyl-ACP methyl ester carboxylesterase